MAEIINVHVLLRMSGSSSRLRYRRTFGLLVTATAWLLAACGADGATVPEEPLVIRTDVGSAVPYEAVTVMVRGATVGATTEATLGDVQLSTAFLDDSSFVIIVPDVAPGAHRLHVRFAGRSGETILTVEEPAAIADASAMVDAAITVVEDALVGIDSLLRVDHIGQIADTARMRGDLTRLEEALASVRLALASASTEELDRLAQFLAANPVLLGESSQQIPAAASGAPLFMGTAVPVCYGASGPEDEVEVCFSLLDDYVVYNLAKLTALAGVAVGLGPATGGLSVLVGGVIIANELYRFNSGLIDRFAVPAILASTEVQMPNLGLQPAALQVSVEPLEFIAGVEHPLTIMGEYRGLASRDLGSSAPAIEAIVTGLDSFGALFERINSVLPSSIRLAQPPFHVGDVDAPLTETRPIPGRYLSLDEGETPAEVQVRSTVEGGQLMVTFSDATYRIEALPLDLAVRYRPPQAPEHTFDIEGVLRPGPALWALTATYSGTSDGEPITCTETMTFRAEAAWWSTSTVAGPTLSASNTCGWGYYPLEEYWLDASASGGTVTFSWTPAWSYSGTLSGWEIAGTTSLAREIWSLSGTFIVEISPITSTTMASRSVRGPSTEMLTGALGDSSLEVGATAPHSAPPGRGRGFVAR